MKEIALHILDIVENSIDAGSKNIFIEIEESKNSDVFAFVVKDDGKGIPSGMIEKVKDPWTTGRLVRKVGMGIPLLKQHTEAAGGSLEINSAEGKGTSLRAAFTYKHIDRQPLGDVCGVLRILFSAGDDINFYYRHVTDDGFYAFNTLEAKSILGISTLRNAELLEQLSDMISNNLEEINAELK